ncbi:hypothetical protein FH972_026265 [Carpinus fangiana]|uniref:Splicing factor Cactin n=1 Tax=Carpinus fangiana TaxID=176857 RepID=A0A5N6L3U7_9ROSI|nr:hypothetical protein FH972_026265 [Carpinus fangiana]
MSSEQEPPWRRQQPSNRGRGARYQPNPTIPRKRPAADEQEDAWVANEDRFVLQQAKKKAEIRVKEGRAKPIDWLAVTLRFIDPSRNPFDDEVDDSELDVVDPEGIFESLDEKQLAELEKDISTYATLEKNEINKEFWETMSIICRERREKTRGSGRAGRGVDSVSGDVDKLFQSKSLSELEALEKQIRTKLRSDEDIDVDYWEHMLRTLLSWKARAKLRQVSHSIVESQMKGLRQQQESEARRVKDEFMAHLALAPVEGESPDMKLLDPQPLLKIAIEDKALPVREERVFIDDIVNERRKVLKLGYVPAKKNAPATTPAGGPKDTHRPSRADDASALYEREAARGVGENEEVFASEEEVTTASTDKWSEKYRPRKPRYFNRVQMGYEWNKYNQTHYDHDNPPPKVVQGYRFNVFYPDLIDKSKAPTYKIERENGRKRGQTFAPAGEEDTCLIRFVAGPPYEDIAFRIVDREWDYSAKRERGFKSSFDKGILQLHFQFKKVWRGHACTASFIAVSQAGCGGGTATRIEERFWTYRARMTALHPWQPVGEAAGTLACRRRINLNARPPVSPARPLESVGKQESFNTPRTRSAGLPKVPSTITCRGYPVPTAAVHVHVHDARHRLQFHLLPACSDDVNRPTSLEKAQPANLHDMASGITLKLPIC